MAGCHHPRPQGTRGRKSLGTVVVLGEGLPCAVGTVGANTQAPLPSSAGTSKWPDSASSQRTRQLGGHGCRGQRPVAQGRHGAWDRPGFSSASALSP